MKTSTIVVALAVGCGGLALAGTAWRPAAKQVQPPVVTEAAAKARGSIHDVDLRLIGADGRAVSLDQLRGHPVLVSMFFGSCPSACPLLIRDLKQLVAQLPEDARARVRVLLISFDPQRDTPAILADVYRRHDLDSRQWILSTPANEDSVRVAAGVLRIRYRPTSEGQFDHTRRITLLDGDGQIRAQSDELAPLAQAVRELTPVASR